ncbi:hypothetical protein DFH27DRAFT_579707 [Peziza echinospora]|nr:hypothetical protein DFH27DRAFT_579707 [Peziza echinospora]
MTPIMHLRPSLIASILLLLTSPIVATPTSNSGPAAPKKPSGGWDFKYESIQAQQNLVFHKCFDDFECARLLVPLDASSPDDKATASIAVIKLASAAEFPEFGSKWGGPVLFNPGGPGVSGVGIFLDSARSLQQVVGKQFSIIGFDSRGINNTLPRVSCFDSTLDKQVFSAKWGGKIAGNPDEVGEAYVRAKLYGSLCDRGTRKEVLRHVNTPAVARDMLSINNALWALAKPGVKKKGLQYYGWSYGSVLGATFATTFPDSVERMVLDGVLDPVDWVTGSVLTYLIDAEKAMDSFYEFCFEAGPLRCKFHTGTSPEDIRTRLNALLLAVRTEPIPYDITPSQPDMLTYGDLKQIVASALNSPLFYFEFLAEFLALVESVRLAGVPLPSDVTQFRSAVTCPADKPPVEFLDVEANTAILCSDMEALTTIDLAEIKNRLELIRAQSPTAAENFLANPLRCLGWKIKGKLKQNVDIFLSRNATFLERKQKVPYLLIGNTVDPLTPLAGAYAMAKIFPKGGAVVAVQEGVGHTTQATPSLCMADVVSTYFATGVIPVNKRCAQEVKPFSGQAAIKKRGMEDERILKNLALVRRMFP